MADSALAHILRRSRLRALTAKAGHALHLDSRRAHPAPETLEKKDVIQALDERFYASMNEYSPEQLSSMAAAGSTVAAGTSTAKTSTAQRHAAQAATAKTTISRVSSAAAAASTVHASTSTSSVAQSSAARTSSAASSSIASSAVRSVAASSSSSASPSVAPSTSSTSTSSIARSTSSAALSTSTTHSTSSTSTTHSTSKAASTTAREITSHAAVQSSSSSSSSAGSSPITSSSISATAAALSSNSDSSSSLSTGAVVGIVFAVVCGVVVVGSFFGWLYRKYTARSYNSSSPWSKIDDDITPYNSEKPGFDDIYGGSTVPVIASSRDLSRARSDMVPYTMYDNSPLSNHAGVGAGALAFGGQGDISPPPSALSYGIDSQGRPYNPHAGRTPMLHTLEDRYGHQAEPYSPYSHQPYSSASDNSRQLVGPGSYGPTSPVNQYGSPGGHVEMPLPSPVPLGGPAHASDADLRDLDEFADDPQMAGLAYTYGDSPTASTFAHTQAPIKHDLPAETYRASDHTSSAPAAPDFSAPAVSPLDPTVPAASSSDEKSRLAPLPLPAFEPLSPLMSHFDTNNQGQSQPLAMYEDEQEREQRRMYQEVAKSAGIDEPVTPFVSYTNASPSPEPMPVPNAQALNQSTASTTSSFSTGMPRLPEIALSAPKPYEHGQPLSPLAEVPTPMSSSSIGVPLPNPFDNPAFTSPKSVSSAPAPPYSPYEYEQEPGTPTSTTATLNTPVPGQTMNRSFPPPDMPGSVLGSPAAGRRWSGGEDVYGGI
ncbi:hypothetical protein I350_05906 [Cryptococcus amylolentus CBS 6273]|uniref:Uncharacterized protein n=1 Tax=Cryptococcus amylolentus CBS 6273 TaxID=1296118 RepID=A0A1E3JQB5_9TREE|nr:hypothetical protein I350_05906 [Cryptococcus amylolentus CBS 6273]